MIASVFRRNLYSRCHKRFLSFGGGGRGVGGSDPSLPNLEFYEDVSRKGKLKRNLFYRIFQVLSNYPILLQSLLPSTASKVIHVFSSGSKSLFSDMTLFIRVHRRLATESRDWDRTCCSLSRKQLELYLTLPADIWRVGPVIILSALPFGQNVVFPIALLFPHKFLSSHFWTNEQKFEFGVKSVLKRTAYAPYVLRNFTLFKITQPSVEKLCDLLAESSQIPPSDIINASYLFGHRNIYDLDSLDIITIMNLSKLHGRIPSLRPRHDLKQYGNLVLQIDQAIHREGIRSLTKFELMSACVLRGFNIKGKTEQEQKNYLEKWIHISTKISRNNVSLLLHLPLFVN